MKTFHMHFKFLVCCVLYQQFINGGVDTFMMNSCSFGSWGDLGVAVNNFGDPCSTGLSPSARLTSDMGPVEQSGNHFSTNFGTLTSSTMFNLETYSTLNGYVTLE